MDFFLEQVDGRRQLRKVSDPAFGAVYVDFCAGRLGHRRKYGGGRSQSIAKAVGLKKGAMPSVLDMTAGLGGDAFVLASLGCRVHMIEKSGVIAQLLADGLHRAQADSDIGPWVKERLSLSHQDSCENLEQLPFIPDVVYVDPMFPEKRNSALARKEIQALQAVVGPDAGEGERLLAAALSVARLRVVVKRPDSAQSLPGRKPDTSISSGNYRFDVYLLGLSETSTQG